MESPRKVEMEVDGEDVVVRELDVFLSQTLAEQLFVLQYPLRPTWRPYEKENLTEVRYKGAKQKLEIEFALSKEELANYYDSQDTSTRQGYSLTSTLVIPQTNYAIGVLRGDQLHLTPLKGTFQLRPSFAHIDQAEEANKKKANPPPEDKDEEKEDQDTKIQVRFKRRESQKAREMRQKSHRFLKQMEEDEPWSRLNYVDYNVKPEDTARTFERLFSSSHATVDFEIPLEEYLDQVAMHKPTDAFQPAATKGENGLTLLELRKLPLEKQFLALFSRAFVVPFVRLQELLQFDSREEEAIGALQRVAILVDGRWVLRSEHCYRGRLGRVREYLLLLFQQRREVRRQDLVERARISPEVAREMLSQIAQLHLSPSGPQVWRLKSQVDERFITKYPELLAAHSQYWEDKTNTIIRNLDVSLNGEEDEVGRPTPTPVPVIPPRYPGEPEVIVDEGGSEQFSGEVVARLQQFLRGMLEEYGVCNLNFLKQHLRERQEMDPVLNSGTPDKLVRAVLHQIAVPINNAFVLKSLGDPLIDKYRSVVMDVFRRSVSTKKKVVEDAMASVGEKPSGTLYQKVMKEFAYTKGSTWIFKSGNG